MTGDIHKAALDENSKELYPHSVNFEGRPPPPAAGYGWDAIQAAIQTQSLHLLRRTDKGQYEYEIWQKQIDRQTYDNAGTFIALSILGWPDLNDPADTDSDMATLTRQERYQAVPPRLTLRLNHYPIPVENSIQYFVLWSTRDMSVVEERTRLDEYLVEQLSCSSSDAETAQTRQGLSKELLPPKPGKKKEWIWFVNPVELRSVATVHHLHVFVKDVDM